MTDHPPGSEPDSGTIARRRGPDLLALVVGLGALTVSLNAMLGGMGWLPGLDLRWVLAGVAILVGLALVLCSTRPRRK